MKSAHAGLPVAVLVHAIGALGPAKPAPIPRPALTVVLPLPVLALSVLSGFSGVPHSKALPELANEVRHHGERA